MLTFLDGELDGADALRTSTHLRVCFECSTDAEVRLLVRKSLRHLSNVARPTAPSARLRRFGADLVESW